MSNVYKSLKNNQNILKIGKIPRIVNIIRIRCKFQVFELQKINKNRICRKYIDSIQFSILLTTIFQSLLN